MAYNSSVLSQLLKLLPRHEFEKQANRCDGQRRSDALSRWSQFLEPARLLMLLAVSDGLLNHKKQLSSARFFRNAVEKVRFVRR